MARKRTRVKRWNNKFFVSKDLGNTHICFASKQKQSCDNGTYYDDSDYNPLIFFGDNMNWLLTGKREWFSLKSGYQAEIEITVKMKVYDSNGKAVEC